MDDDPFQERISWHSWVALFMQVADAWEGTTRTMPKAISQLAWVEKTGDGELWQQLSTNNLSWQLTFDEWSRRWDALAFDDAARRAFDQAAFNLERRALDASDCLEVPDPGEFFGIMKQCAQSWNLFESNPSAEQEPLRAMLKKLSAMSKEYADITYSHGKFRVDVAILQIQLLLGDDTQASQTEGNILSSPGLLRDVLGELICKRRALTKLTRTDVIQFHRTAAVHSLLGQSFLMCGLNNEHVLQGMQYKRTASLLFRRIGAGADATFEDERFQIVAPKLDFPKYLENARSFERSVFVEWCVTQSSQFDFSLSRVKQAKDAYVEYMRRHLMDQSATAATWNNSHFAEALQGVPSFRPFPMVDIESDEVLVLAKTPVILAWPDFLSAEQCGRLIAKCRPIMSTWYLQEVKGGTGEDRVRIEARLPTTWTFEIMEKLTTRLNWPINKFELMDVVMYSPGQMISEHIDQPANRIGNKKCISVFIYLNSVEEGGETEFPLLGVGIQPVAGTAVVHFPAVKGSLRLPVAFEGPHGMSLSEEGVVTEVAGSSKAAGVAIGWKVVEIRLGHDCYAFSSQNLEWAVDQEIPYNLVFQAEIATDDLLTRHATKPCSSERWLLLVFGWIHEVDATNANSPSSTVHIVTKESIAGGV